MALQDREESDGGVRLDQDIDMHECGGVNLNEETTKGAKLDNPRFVANGNRQVLRDNINAKADDTRQMSLSCSRARETDKAASAEQTYEYLFSIAYRVQYRSLQFERIRSVDAVPMGFYVADIVVRGLWSAVKETTVWNISWSFKSSKDDQVVRGPWTIEEPIVYRQFPANLYFCPRTSRGRSRGYIQM
ncbi:Hypothetical protein D9617_15g043050 [Elsinoe fawcettii]|nr:Hypothetical protein D9617_15g043050 [Elsinoe fawcettii]